MLLVLPVLLFSLSGCVLAADVLVPSGGDWCAAINSATLNPGDTVRLADGATFTRVGKCVITQSRGTTQSPIVLSSETYPPVSDAQRPRIHLSGQDNLVEIKNGAQNLVIKGLKVSDTFSTAFRVYDTPRITFDDLLFERIPSQAITANSQGNCSNLKVLNSRFVDMSYTILYFGCAGGATCTATNYLVENNRVYASSPSFVTGASSGTGYAFEAKTNSWGTLRSNTFYNTKGPGIAVYGSSTGAGTDSVVEYNLVSGSQNDAPIWIGGGPALVRNNVAINTGGSGWGIYAQVRNVQSNVRVVFNTVIGMGGANTALRLSGWNSAGQNNVLAHNVVARGTTSTVTAATNTGNHECATIAGCFDSATETAPYDLWPQVAGPVPRAACTQDAWFPTRDFMVETRSCSGSGTFAGAFDRVGSTPHVIPAFPGARPVPGAAGATTGATTTAVPATTTGTSTGVPTTTGVVPVTTTGVATANSQPASTATLNIIMLKLICAAVVVVLAVV
jgi:Right handed beta helix region